MQPMFGSAFCLLQRWLVYAFRFFTEGSKDFLTEDRKGRKD